MTSHKSYNEPDPRLIGPFYSARFSVSPPHFFVSSRVLLRVFSGRSCFLFPPVSSLLRLPEPLVQFGRWQSIHPSRPRTPSIQTIPEYSRDNEKALCLRAFEGTCGICAGALCRYTIIPSAETSEQRRRRRRRRLDPVFFMPRALEISLARHYVNNECLSQNGLVIRSDFRDASSFAKGCVFQFQARRPKNRREISLIAFLV